MEWGSLIEQFTKAIEERNIVFTKMGQTVINLLTHLNCNFIFTLNNSGFLL